MSSPDNNLLISERDRTLRLELPAVTARQIVCGDCSAPPIHWARFHNRGLGLKSIAINEATSEPWPEQPIKTLLTLDGRCNKCGGRSYELAVNVFAERGLTVRAKIRARVEQQELERLYRQEETRA